jgi:hypothetical protein
MFQGLVFMFATFQALFSLSFLLLCSGSMCRSWNVASINKPWPTLLLPNQLSCYGRLQSSHKQISSANFPFPMCERVVDSISAIFHVCPFGQYGDYEMWQASTSLLVMRQATCNKLLVCFPLIFHLCCSDTWTIYLGSS